jgi:tetratricopeptide (TPR) repeat protein
MLRPFHARLRGEIERVGGTLDKLIGERGAGSEGVVGDVVNTAARLQGVAAVNGVVVGEATWRATQALFEYERLAPVQVKGKAEPVPIWRVLGARSRPGVDLAERPPTPLIGRGEELAALRRSYRRAFAEDALQLVAVLGEPGVGKSRLVRELAGFVDARPELVAWRRGHCLSYGEAVGFWALGEIIKAQAGILESDDPREVAAKLDTAVRAVAGDASEREWLKARLAPLVGLATVGEAPAGRDESLVAWRRFLHLVAGQSPLILVIEDLHWADPALLDFLEQLGRPGERGRSARGRHRQAGAARPAPRLGRRTAACDHHLAVSPRRRADRDAARRPARPVDAAGGGHSLLLERAGGNPLYAEEFVRLLTDRDQLTRRGRLASAAGLPLPDTVQALIAARLDTLAPGRARVVAKVARAAFQAGRVAEAAGAYQEAIDGLAAEGEVVGQGEALNRLCSVLWNQGEARRARDALVRAVELLERTRPGPELCSAYAQMAMDRVMSGHPQEALSWADKAVALAEELGGLPEERLRALDSRGVARGDLGGMDDLRAALKLDLGRWDEAVDTASALIMWERDHGGQYVSEMAHQVKARVLLCAARWTPPGSWPGSSSPSPRDRRPALLVPALATAAAVEQAAGQHGRARSGRGGAAAGRRPGGGRSYLGQHIADLVRVCLAIGHRGTAEALAAQVNDGVARNRHGLLSARAPLAEADGALDEAALRYDEAAAPWTAYGHQLERARALLGAGRSLLALGRPEGRRRFQDAQPILAALHAEPLLAEVNAAPDDTTTLRYNRRT